MTTRQGAFAHGRYGWGREAESNSLLCRKASALSNGTRPRRKRVVSMPKLSAPKGWQRLPDLHRFCGSQRPVCCCYTKPLYIRASSMPGYRKHEYDLWPDFSKRFVVARLSGLSKPASMPVFPSCQRIKGSCSSFRAVIPKKSCWGTRLSEWSVIVAICRHALSAGWLLLHGDHFLLFAITTLDTHNPRHHSGDGWYDAPCGAGGRGRSCTDHGEGVNAVR